MWLQVIDSIHEKIAYPLQYGLNKLVPNPEPLFSISEIGLRGLERVSYNLCTCQEN